MHVSPGLGRLEKSTKASYSDRNPTTTVTPSTDSRNNADQWLDDEKKLGNKSCPAPEDAASTTASDDYDRILSRAEIAIKTIEGIQSEC